MKTLTRARGRLEELKALPIEDLALYRKRKQALIYKQSRYCKDLEEAIAARTQTAKSSL